MSHKIILDDIEPGKVDTKKRRMSLLYQEDEGSHDEKQAPAFEIIPEEVATRRLPQEKFKKIINHNYCEDDEGMVETSYVNLPTDTQDKQPNTSNSANNHYNNTYNQYSAHTFRPEFSNYSGYNQYGTYNSYSRRNTLTPLEIANHLAENEYIFRIDKCLYIYDDSKKHYVYADADAIIAVIRQTFSFEKIKHLRLFELKSVHELMFSDNQIVRSNLQAENGLVLFENGMFDIMTGKKVKGPPTRFTLYKVNAKYGYSIETPCFDRFLEDVSLGDEQIKKLIWAFLGYCLIPDLGNKCFFVLGTAPNTGKSLLGALLEDLVGSELVSNISLYDFHKDFALGPIVGKTLNISMDLRGGKLSDAAVENLKLLTGKKDKITINEKHIKRISYFNIAKLVFGTNVPINVTQGIDGFWERMIIIPFLNSIPEEDRDPDLYEKIWEERDGIVNQAMKRAKKLINQNYRFPKCQISEIMKAHWMHCEDYEVKSFVENCCDLSDKFAETRTVDLYGAYIKYCETNYEQPKTKNVFSSTLRDLYRLEPRRKVGNEGQHRGYRGIRLKSQGGNTT